MAPDPLTSRITALPASPARAAALERLQEAAERGGFWPSLQPLLADPPTQAFLASALGDSPFLQDLAVKDVSRLAAILQAAPETRIAEQIGSLANSDWESRSEAMTGLRRAKQNVALTLGLADLARALPLDAVTAALTSFADAALQAALRFTLAEAGRSGKWVGEGAEPGLFILAMGKYGADELNYSSDIDLIALFDPEAGGLAEGVEPSTFWVKVVRTLVTLLQERTSDGYVFRTDLRLRPDPGATSVALSAPAALVYYESMGQNWERAALVKARVCAGNMEAGRQFIAEIAPFIWRKYLDFAAIADIHSIKRQVHAQRGHAAVRVAGHDIKRGRGGIREIEFFVQTQQLIAGGRDRSLRGRGTRSMLARLTERGWIDTAARDELDAACVFLRTLEHRLQMVRDEQTHTMPTNPDELARIGRLMGYADPTAFEADVRRVLEGVARRYSELFEEAPDLSAATGSLVFTGTDDDPETIETLRKLGFAEPAHVTATVRAWHFGRFAAMRSAAAREGLTEITPALLAAFSRAGNPDAALRAFDSLLKALPAGAQLFALLLNNRELLDLLATILGAAPRLAEIFTRRPHVADALIDPGSLNDAVDRAALDARLAVSVAEASSYEDVLNRCRLFAAEQRFLISVGLLNRRLTPASAGRAFSDLAETVVAELFTHTVRAFQAQHGTLPAGRTAIVAFGRLGSREMTAGSDLDLIVVYDHAPDASQSDGRRPLPPSQYFTRLTQRLVAALSAPTAEGIAYPVDLRLRPSGRAGPLATSAEAFEQYQLSEAWTWEHMAMSRGRPIAGDAGLMNDLAATLDRIVGRQRDRERLAGEIAAMRARIEAEKPAAHPFDVKLAPGGLVDCEFAAQFLVLAGMGRVAGEPTLETLRRGRQTGALAEEVADRLIGACSLQGCLLQVQRIADDRPFSPDAAPQALKRLMAELAQAALNEDPTGTSAPWALAPDAEDTTGFKALAAELAKAQGHARRALETVLGTPIGNHAAADRGASPAG